VTDLKRQIETFVEHYNEHPTPFLWTASADSILAKHKMRETGQNPARGHNASQGQRIVFWWDNWRPDQDSNLGPSP